MNFSLPPCLPAEQELEVAISGQGFGKANKWLLGSIEAESYCSPSSLGIFHPRDKPTASRASPLPGAELRDVAIFSFYTPFIFI